MDISYDPTVTWFYIRMDRPWNDEETDGYPDQREELYEDLERANATWRDSEPGLWLSDREDGFEFWWRVERDEWLFGVAVRRPEVVREFKEKFCAPE